MGRESGRSTRIAVVATLLSQLACGGSPTTPTVTGATTTISIIEVTGPGGVFVVAPGQTLQLAAVAAYASGARVDITATAVWQSSDPNTALATSSGLVKGGQAGHVDISASVSGVSGRVGVDVREAPQPTCAAATLSAAAVSIAPSNNLVRANVVTPLSDCRWTASSDEPWLNPGDWTYAETGSGAVFDPGHSGSGEFEFTASANRTLLTRVARVRVAFADGTQLVYSVTQTPPTCAITLSPAERTYPYAASAGTFNVHVEPSSCSWTAWTDPRTDPSWNLRASGGGVGDGTVSYSANPTPTNLSSIAFWIHVIPSNPADPAARFHLFLGPHYQ